MNAVYLLGLGGDDVVLVQARTITRRRSCSPRTGLVEIGISMLIRQG